jgi:hypothetical protein
MLVQLKLLETNPIKGSWREELAERPGSWLTMVSARNRHAAAGASQRKDSPDSPGLVAPKSFRLSLGDGRRGCQERN